ncbi:GNAT family N-acetyltransferase [Pediococcus siamensis]|uniref:GNAT family N-acetyltransferase n=1 Tax=Pediococcus siamensis TaxID=381829 RepID=UPI00399F8691
MTQIMPMNAQQANAYLNWQYPEPYTFYNFPPSISRSELLNEILNGNSDYFSVLDKQDRLFGIYEYQFHNGIMEIGLGIRPEDTGKGYGEQFVKQCIAFGQQHYHYFSKITLEVASFNQRAIHLYQKMGFKKTSERDAHPFGIPTTFISMTLNNPT